MYKDTVVVLLPNCHRRRELEAGSLWKRYWSKQKTDWEASEAKVKQARGISTKEKQPRSVPTEARGELAETMRGLR